MKRVCDNTESEQIIEMMHNLRSSQFYSLSRDMLWYIFQLLYTHAIAKLGQTCKYMQHVSSTYIGELHTSWKSCALQRMREFLDARSLLAPCLKIMADKNAIVAGHFVMQAFLQTPGVVNKMKFYMSARDAVSAAHLLGSVKAAFRTPKQTFWTCAYTDDHQRNGVKRIKVSGQMLNIKMNFYGLYNYKARDYVMNFARFSLHRVYTKDFEGIHYENIHELGYNRGYICTYGHNAIYKVATQTIDLLKLGVEIINMEDYPYEMSHLLTRLTPYPPINTRSPDESDDNNGLSSESERFAQEYNSDEI